ncbi:hypothetical protein [Bacillus sp. EB600]|uniref:hypothetical protein n=1 Tax=Bacillus sp. EB600 TaxID=2806345 RepID=UPI00210D4BE8|nr:hypothetical protein [Bacillus sp. EB600]MCQ6280101.1 hypothetical protein [Bacillus sp. EB600]
MNQSFPIFCYTFARNCPEPDTSINLEDFIGSSAKITKLENVLGEQLRDELKRLGGNKPLPAIRKSKKRPSIECRILSYK